MTFDLQFNKISQSDIVGTLFTWKSTFFSTRIPSFHLCNNLFLTLLILVLRFTRLRLSQFILTQLTFDLFKDSAPNVLKLIWKRPRFVPFGLNWPTLGPNSTSLMIAHKISIFLLGNFRFINSLEIEKLQKVFLLWTCSHVHAYC